MTAIHLAIKRGKLAAVRMSKHCVLVRRSDLEAGSSAEQHAGSQNWRRRSMKAKAKPLQTPSDMPKSLRNCGFRKTPMCEVLTNVPAEYFSHYQGKWRFVSLDISENWNDYWFTIAQFFKSPRATTDWIAHLSEKGWFDAKDFARMLHRFRRFFCLSLLARKAQTGRAGSKQHAETLSKVNI